jgi:uncharacterized repeat protein (TIGR03899 family)
MPEVNLIKLDGKPLEKLVEVISKGIGVLYKPRAIRKEAEAKAYKIDLIEKAKARAKAEGAEIELEVYERIEDRLLFKESRRQRNIDNISHVAVEQLNQEETVSDEPVDEDWATRFFNLAEDVSNEEMQNLWGRILAGEVKKPKTYSLRTLELLKNLNKSDAECFMKFARLAISANNTSFILSFNNEDLLKEKYQLGFNERLLLEELGLINALDLQFRIPETGENSRQQSFIIGDTIILADLPKETPELKVNVLVLTKIGQELLGLIDSTPELDYIQLFTSKFRRTGITVGYAKIQAIENGFVRYQNMQEVPYTEVEGEAEEERLEKEEAAKKRKEEQEKRQAEKEEREKERLAKQKERES